MNRAEARVLLEERDDDCLRKVSSARDDGEWWTAELLRWQRWTALIGFLPFHPFSLADQAADQRSGVIGAGEPKKGDRFAKRKDAEAMATSCATTWAS